MQIKETYGQDIAQYHQISDEEEREDRKKKLVILTDYLNNSVIAFQFQSASHNATDIK